MTETFSMPRATVAAVIPTKNVAAFIEGTLESLKFCDEVIIVDMFSTDDTRKICERYRNVRFFQREGYIYHNYNFGVAQAASDWIIRIDSDERLSPELQKEIHQTLLNGPAFDEYCARQTVYIVGHPFTEEQSAGRTILYRKGSLHYLGQSEHESLVSVTGKPVSSTRLDGYYHHFSTPTLGTFIRKMDYYIDRDLERASPATTPTPSPGRILYRAVRRFIEFYFQQKMRREGMHGFTLALLNTIYYTYQELRRHEFAKGWRDDHIRVREEYDRFLAAQSLPFTGAAQSPVAEPESSRT